MAAPTPSLPFTEDFKEEPSLKATELNGSDVSATQSGLNTASQNRTSTPLSGTTDGGDLEDDFCEAPCRHHPPSTKYPSLDLPHANNLHKFIRDVSHALKSAYPRNKDISGNYDTAHMLFLRWEADDLGTQSEIDELRPLLQNLKFSPQNESVTTEQYNIPSEDPQDSLEEILVRRRNKYAKKAKQLLLIYYGGHGKMNEMRQCIWYPWLSPPPGSYEQPEIDWTSLQTRLHRCEGDVVFILDCCHASSMVRGGHSAWKGFKELLVASGKNEKTHGVNDNSFTRAIIRELKDLKGKATSISGLQAAMVEHQEIHGLRQTPIRIGLSERANRFESLQLVHPKNLTGEDSVKSIDSDALDYGSRVLISIRLRDPSNPLLVRDWLPWLQGQAPQDVLDLKVNWTNFVRPEAAFDHGSTLMLFSIPLTIWNALPHDKAYSFIDVVKSGNLLSTTFGKDKGSQTVPESTAMHSHPSPIKRKAFDQPTESALLPTPPNPKLLSVERSALAMNKPHGAQSLHVNYEAIENFQPYSVGKSDDRWILPPHIVFPWEFKRRRRYL